MVADARAWRRKYATRHIKISPKETLENGQVRDAVELLAGEFGFDPEHCVIVSHRKPRHHDAASPVHYHVYAPEVDPVTGRVLSSRWSYARQEKISRLLEVRWGHTVIQGKFNDAVLKRLRSEGRGDDADLLVGDGLNKEFKPQSTHADGLGPEVLRKAERSMADIAQALQDAQLLSDGPVAFRAALAQQGLRVVPGTKKDRWVVEAQSFIEQEQPTDKPPAWVFAGALHRLLKLEVAATNNWMNGTAPEGGFDDSREQDEGKELGISRLRRPAGRHARPGRAPAGGPAGHDADSRGGLGFGEPGAPLMSLLDAPGMVSRETALDRIEELLTESVAQQRVTNEKLDAIIRILLGTAGDVKPPVKARRTRQGMPSEANA